MIVVGLFIPGPTQNSTTIHLLLRGPMCSQCTISWVTHPPVVESDSNLHQ